MYDRILVPTDGGGPATAALEYGAKLAARLESTVHVLHVTEAPLEEDETDALDGAGDRKRTGEAIPDRAGEWVRAEGVAVVDAVRSGDPLEEIPDYAREEGIDAIVMGTHGRTGIGRFVLGSVTEHVVRTAAIPVLVVRGDDDVRTTLPSETVVVPIDDSEHAEAALEEGIEVAMQFDATLHVLSVVDVSPIGLEPQVDLQVNRLEEGAQRVIDDAAERATARGVDDVVSSMSFGSIHRGITSYAVDNDADLLVMGTHGRSGLDRYLLGSVTERVLRTAPAPVLTVRARESE
ncbi:universal stress protein [Halomontanus rarus]|uniref:universal stress protein n=1 Tax=Halomontanus rarus TaxID=3034020 RepID=UPI0023E7A8F8|nr:universal stress protein [Halovivax sp. TS33]